MSGRQISDPYARQTRLCGKIIISHCELYTFVIKSVVHWQQFGLWLVS